MAGPTHYERLGVAADADGAAIRDAYRRLARQHHPDASAGDETSMAHINEAYRVLADPARRAMYDASLRPGAASADAPAGASADATAPTTHAPMPPAFSGVRVPWRLVAAVAVAGTVGVIALSQFTEPPAAPTPDGIIREGGCVTIDAAGFALDDVCTGDPAVDIVVQRFVALDETCPFATAAHQDRQGLGIACVVRR